MPDCPDWLLRLVFEFIYGVTPPEGEWHSFLHSKDPELAKGVAELSNIYTRQRQRITGKLLKDPLLHKAYLTYFLPCNLSKVKTILKEIFAHPRKSEFVAPNLRLLDLGCGPGTHVLGFLDFLAEEHVELDSVHCVAVDSLKRNLLDTHALFQRYVSLRRRPDKVAQCTLQTELAELIQPLRLRPDLSFNFIVLGNVLNELFVGDEKRTQKRYEVISTVATKWLAPNGFLILIEPAMRETSRELLLLRDLLLERSDLKIYSPCVHSLHCPAVASDNLSDWCHEDRPWNAPSMIRDIDALVGNHKSSLKYSYTVFNRMGISVRESALWQAWRESHLTHYSQTGEHPESPDSPEGPHVWRVVSERIEEKGKSAAYFCGSKGRVKVTRLRKDRSDTNQDFEGSDRGQVVLTRGLKRKNEKDWRVEAETQVRRLI
jgi:ribosomal protein RSM22 (predicted rRNA methylase)